MNPALLDNEQSFHRQVPLRLVLSELLRQGTFSTVAAAAAGARHCYLTLPDAFILLFVVTGTRCPLVPLVVLAAEAFTTI